jgi:hypothetical protein
MAVISSTVVVSRVSTNFCVSLSEVQAELDPFCLLLSGGISIAEVMMKMGKKIKCISVGSLCFSKF